MIATTLAEKVIQYLAHLAAPALAEIEGELANLTIQVGNHAFGGVITTEELESVANHAQAVVVPPADPSPASVVVIESAPAVEATVDEAPSVEGPSVEP